MREDFEIKIDRIVKELNGWKKEGMTKISKASINLMMEHLKKNNENEKVKDIASKF